MKPTAARVAPCTPESTCALSETGTQRPDAAEGGLGDAPILADVFVGQS